LNDKQIFFIVTDVCNLKLVIGKKKSFFIFVSCYCAWNL